MFSISIVDAAMGLELLAFIVAVRLFIYILRQLVAIHKVKVCYKSLQRWNKRLEWAVEDNSFTDAQGFEFSEEVLVEIVQSRKAAFNKAVDQRNLIRF
jgi:hypothetical protein